MAAAKQPQDATETPQDATGVATDADALQRAADSIAALWANLEAELTQASDAYVARSEELDRLLTERGELAEQAPALERDLELLPQQATRANMAGDAQAENEARRRFNESSGRLSWIHERQTEIESRLRELGFRTADPDPDRASREAQARLQRDSVAARERAADKVEYECEVLTGLVKSRADAALLRDSEELARGLAVLHKQHVEAQRTAAIAARYEQRTNQTLRHAEMMQDREPEPERTYGP